MTLRPVISATVGANSVVLQLQRLHHTCLWRLPCLVTKQDCDSSSPSLRSCSLLQPRPHSSGQTSERCPSRCVHPTPRSSSTASDGLDQKERRRCRCNWRPAHTVWRYGRPD